MKNLSEIKRELTDISEINLHTFLQAPITFTISTIKELPKSFCVDKECKVERKILASFYASFGLPPTFQVDAHCSVCDFVTTAHRSVDPEDIERLGEVILELTLCFIEGINNDIKTERLFQYIKFAK